MSIMHPVLLFCLSLQPTTSTTRLVAMENASYTVHNMPGCLMEMDTINFRMATPYGRAHPLLKCLKMLVYFTALGRIEEDLIGPASQSDNEMMRATVIGQALTAGKYNEQLNWPLRFKWRPESGQRMTICSQERKQMKIFWPTTLWGLMLLVNLRVRSQAVSKNCWPRL